MLDTSLDTKAVFEEHFNGPTRIFVDSLVPELFTNLLENYQHEQIIAANEQLQFLTGPRCRVSVVNMQLKARC